jgi:hypothetical protein
MSSSYIQNLYSSAANLINLDRAAVLGFTRKRLGKLIELLTLHGIRIQHHFEYFKTSYNLPEDIDVVLVSTTNNSHACKGLVSEARKRGLPVVFIPDSKSKAKAILEQNNFRELTAFDVVPNVIQGNEIMGSLVSSVTASLAPKSSLPIPPKPNIKEELKLIQGQKEHIQQTQTTQKLPDLVVIREAAVRTEVNERKIKDLINQSFITYIEQEDLVYVSVLEIENYKTLGTSTPTMTKEQEIDLLIPHYLPLVAKDFNSFGYEYNRQFTKVQKDLLDRSRRPRLWKKALTKAREILGIKLSVQYNHESYRAEIDRVQYAKALVDYKLEGADLALLEQREEITIIRQPKEEKTMPKKKVTKTEQKKEEKTLKSLIEEIRQHMNEKNIVRLEITAQEAKADVVTTVDLMKV